MSVLVANPCTSNASPKVYTAEGASDIYFIRNGKRGDIVIVTSETGYQIWRFQENYDIEGAATEGVDYIIAKPCGYWVMSGGGGDIGGVGWVNVKEYGALGDGVTDDTVAIQAAIDYAMASGRQSTVYFPPGIYRTTAPLTVSGGNTQTLRMRGEGWVGASNFTPMEWHGSMIRYEGTTSAAVVVGSGATLFHKFEMAHIRVGSAGQATKPDGVKLQLVDETIFDQVQVNGGFTNGLVLEGVSLTHFNKLKILANEVGLLVKNHSSGAYLADCSFNQVNFYLNSVAHVKIEGSIRNVTFNYGWLEHSPYAFWFRPSTDINTLTVDNVEIKSTTVNGSAVSGSLAVFVDGGSLSNGIYVSGFRMLDSMFYVDGPHAVDFRFSNNTGTRLCRGVEMRNIHAYGVTTAAFYSDWANTEVFVTGAPLTVDGFATGTFKPIADPAQLGHVHYMITEIDKLDFSGGGVGGSPLRLPQGNLGSFSAGQFAWSEAQVAPYWTDGSTAVYPVGRDESGNVTLAGKAQFDSDSTAGNTRFLLWDISSSSLKRVSIGAADSGGAGFKVLRIPN